MVDLRRGSRTQLLFVALGASSLRLTVAFAQVGLTFAVLEDGGTATDLGAVAGCRSLALLVALAVGGMVGAGRGRRGIVLGSLTLGATSVLPLAVHRQGIAVLATCLMIHAVCSAVLLPVVAVLVAEVSVSSTLQRANATTRTAASLAAFVGPAMGSSIAVVAGSRWCFVASGVAAGLAAVMFGRVAVLRDRTSAEPRVRNVAAVRAAWSTIAPTRTNPDGWIGTGIAVFAVLNGLWLAWLGVIAPVFAVRAYGRGMWAAVVAVHAAGLVAGGLIAMRARPRRRVTCGVGCFALTAVPASALAMHATGWVLICSAAAAGAGIELFAVLWQTAVQLAVPRRTLSVVFAIDMAGSTLGVPVCQLCVGPLVAYLGSAPCSAAVAVGIVAGCAGMAQSARSRTNTFRARDRGQCNQT